MCTSAEQENFKRMSIQNKKKKVKGYREEQRIEIACESKMRGTINYMENG